MEGQEVTTDPGEVLTAFRENWGCEDAGGFGGQLIGDPGRREMVVHHVYGVRWRIRDGFRMSCREKRGARGRQVKELVGDRRTRGGSAAVKGRRTVLGRGRSKRKKMSAKGSATPS